MIAHPMIFLKADRILCRVHTEFFKPFCVDIEAPRAILHDSAVPILSFSAEEPIDENFCGIGMRRIFDDPHNTEAVARRQAFLGSRRRLDRQTRFDERFRLTPTDAERQSDLAFGEGVSQLPQIPGQEEILLDEFLEKLFSLDLPHKRPDRLSRARHPWIAESNLPFPFGREVVVEGTELF